MRTPYLFASLGIVVLGLAFAPNAAPCGAAFRNGEPAWIVREDVIMAWDPASHTQHFIRSERFAGKGKDFGFLVPTPSVPKLEEVKQAQFDQVMNFWRPRQAPETRGGGGFGGGAGGVNVVSVQKVAGFEAAILEASNPQSLSKWLGDHNYPSRPALTEWYAPYVRMAWRMSAFKIARKLEGEQSETSPVKMSFSIQDPFYPYREPKDPTPTAGPRLLRVVFLSPGEMQGYYTGSTSRWRARTVLSRQLKDSERSMVISALGLQSADLPRPLWLTVFEDTTVVRPDSDLTFRQIIGR